MRSIVFDRLGDPRADDGLLTLRDIPPPELRPGHTSVRVALVPINPSDLLFMSGVMPGPVRPALPGQIAGFCGVGFVETSAGGSLLAGTLVAFNAVGSWAEYVSVPTASLIPLPPDFDLELAAQFANLVTAWQLIEMSGVETGGWLALTAGYSSVAILILQIAARRGIRVLSIVRSIRTELDLIALGAAGVIASDEGGVSAAVNYATGNTRLNGIIDCVAGPLTGILIRLCAPLSKLLIYGSLDERDMRVTGHDILYRFLEIRPYNYPFTFTSPTSAQDFALLDKVSRQGAEHKFHVPVGGIYAMTDYKAAIDAHLTGGSFGKRFLRIDR